LCQINLQLASCRIYSARLSKSFGSTNFCSRLRCASCRISSARLSNLFGSTIISSFCIPLRCASCRMYLVFYILPLACFRSLIIGSVRSRTCRKRLFETAHRTDSARLSNSFDVLKSAKPRMWTINTAHRIDSARLSNLFGV